MMPTMIPRMTRTATPMANKLMVEAYAFDGSGGVPGFVSLRGFHMLDP